ncbi:MAG: prephenate dehydrogenase [Candidatus Omnitrophota bacterium]
MKFKKIAIVGIGLVGGSLGLSIKRKKLAQKVIGIVHHKKTIKEALNLKAVDKATLNLKDIKDADLIILATPVNIILRQLPLILNYAKENTLIIDVGSTKNKIIKLAEKLMPSNKKIDFIGTHPLAGSEKKGLYFAKIDLFKNSLCILVPTKFTKKENLEKIKTFWRALGADTKTINAKKHDEILSFTSHLPHLVSFALMDSMPAKYLNFSASGLKDTTRLSSSDALVWQDIFFSNKENLIKAIANFEKSLKELKNKISASDKTLLNKLKSIKRKKESIL